MAEKMFCMKCGSEMSTDDKFCRNCANPNPLWQGNSAGSAAGAGAPQNTAGTGASGNTGENAAFNAENGQADAPQKPKKKSALSIILITLGITVGVLVLLAFCAFMGLYVLTDMWDSITEETTVAAENTTTEAGKTEETEPEESATEEPTAEETTTEEPTTEEPTTTAAVLSADEMEGDYVLYNWSTSSVMMAEVEFYESGYGYICMDEMTFSGRYGYYYEGDLSPEGENTFSLEMYAFEELAYSGTVTFSDGEFILEITAMSADDESYYATEGTYYMSEPGYVLGYYGSPDSAVEVFVGYASGEDLYYIELSIDGETYYFGTMYEIEGSTYLAEDDYEFEYEAEKYMVTLCDGGLWIAGAGLYDVDGYYTMTSAVEAP